MQQVAANVVVAPADGNVEVDKTLKLDATVTDSNDNEIADADVDWSSSAEAIATVDEAGLVSGVAVGEAMITATSGSASGSATVTVILVLPDFEPAADQDVEGTIDAGTVTVPAGVTLTVTGPLTINASGNVQIDGTLAGDCDAITINGAADVTITGTIGNECAVDPGGDTQNLEIYGNGVLDLDGATITSSGDVVIQNDPFLTDSDFDDVAPPLAPPLGSAAQNHSCDVKGGTFTPTPPNAPPDPDTGMPADGRTWRPRCRGNLNLGGNPKNSEPTTISGQNGAAGASEDLLTEATGENGTNGGKLKILSTGNIVFGGNGGTIIKLGHGGTAPANGAGTGGSATATAGNGGEPGGLEVKAQGGITIGAGTLTIEAGNGGAGGVAEANATDGHDANGATANVSAGQEAIGPEAEDGGDATATGGTGGNSLEAQLRAKGAVAGAGLITITGGDGGKGGNATANAGKGGDGNEEHPPGADGGTMDAVGGDGGDAQGKDLLGAPIGSGGDGGALSVSGGMGGNGWSDCVMPDYKPGGDGGDGGDAFGANGLGGDGGEEAGMNGAVSIAPATGDGGHGGDGLGPGLGGFGGADFILATGVTPDPNGPAFRDGLDGWPCEKKTFELQISLDFYPSNQDNYIGDVIGTIQMFMMWIDQEGRVYVDDMGGPLPPMMSGGIDTEHNFHAIGTGPITATFDIPPDPPFTQTCNTGWQIQGTLNPNSWEMTGTLEIGPIPCVMGANTFYSVTGTVVTPGPEG